ncbi:GTPase Era [Candidatus Acetothermia bacterium]|nr:GTPase Era [Candidatus Acetothermia bacterium]MBI3460130.1 GTPase Era [Candidatus Acetothermia bacterium]MBI3659849.1 GTPase Era [Candidatus Acetothermia bacterium]
MTGFKSGFVGVLGQANVGKSSFINAILGKKILIVSSKPQSTRNRIKCICNFEDAQMIFVDTPGLHKPQNRLSKYLSSQAYAALEGLDALVYMVEPWSAVSAGDRDALRHLKKFEQPIILLINKIDTIRDDSVQRTMEAYRVLELFQDIWPISCKLGIQMGQALEAIKNVLPEGPRYFTDESSTDRPEEFVIAEFIREKIYELTRAEIPYSCAVDVFEVREREDKRLIEIFANIYVARDSQKGILVGNGGKMIRQIGQRARREIELLLGAHVFLDLQVKVSKDWNEDERLIKKMIGQER